MKKFYTPRSIVFFLSLIGFCFIVNSSISNAGGPPVGYTGAPGESNCTACHSGISLNGGAYNSSVQIVSNMPNGRYALNTTYQITVKLATRNCVRYGFETIALNSSNTMAGSFTVTNATRTKRVLSGTKQYMEQTNSGTTSSYTDSTDWSFNWTSPTTNVGNVTFYLNGNVANNNNSDTYDTIYSKSFTFQPYTPPAATIVTTASNICEGDSVKFTANGTNSPTGYDWTFPGGIPATSTSQVQWVKFNSAGAAVCSLYITNTSGTSPQAVKTINISAYPSASINATGANTFCQGDSVLLSGNTGAGYTYTWFLDGISIGQTNSSFYAKTAGNYTLKVTNGGGCSALSSAIAIIVNPKPTLNLLSAGATSICSGDSVLLTVSGANANNRIWYNGTSILNGVNDTFYYAKTPGLYTVNATNSSTCQTTSNGVNVSVNSYPTASVASTPVGCIYTLTANSGVGYTYQWYKNDTAMANDTAINHTVNASGVYKVKVTNANGCSVISQPQTFNVANLPDVTLTRLGNPTFCIGDSCVISVPQGPSYAYQWYKNGILITGATLRSITIKDSGSYLVKINNGTCENISLAAIIKVLAIPDATITKSNLAFCVGDSCVISVPQGPSYAYQWYKNGILITGATLRSITIKDSGSYFVRINNGACENISLATIIKVLAIPDATIISSNLAFCAGDSANLQAKAISGFIYAWFRNDSIIPNASLPSLKIFNAGRYHVNISNGVCNQSGNDIVIKVNPLPSVPFITRDKQTLAASTAFQYQWFKDGLIIPAAQSQSFTPISDGKYYVKITDANGCSNVSLEYNYTLTAVKHLSNAFDVKIYPTPTDKYLNVEFNGSERYVIEIIDMCGKSIYKNTNMSNSMVLDVRVWEKGMYIVIIKSAEKEYYARFLVN